MQQEHPEPPENKAVPMKHQPSPPTPRQAARAALHHLDDGASPTAASPQELHNLRYD
jgi:hypothetical protein